MPYCNNCGNIIEGTSLYCSECRIKRFSGFDDEVKIAFFDEIAENYFDKNFGTMLKSDFETLIFSYYIENLIENNQNFDDYSISKKLGISESRVRTLKERKELKYPYKKYNWKQAFSEIIKYAHYDEKNELVQLKIEDVNLLKDLRYFMNSHHYFDVYQLNPKLFQCKLEFFIQICMDIDNEFRLSDDAKAHIKSLDSASDSISAVEKIISGDYKGGIKELLLEASETAFEEIADKLPFGKFGGKIVKDIFDVIKKKGE